MMRLQEGGLCEACIVGSSCRHSWQAQAVGAYAVAVHVPGRQGCERTAHAGRTP